MDCWRIAKRKSWRNSGSRKRRYIHMLQLTLWRLWLRKLECLLLSLWANEGIVSLNCENETFIQHFLQKSIYVPHDTTGPNALIMQWEVSFNLLTASVSKTEVLKDFLNYATEDRSEEVHSRPCCGRKFCNRRVQFANTLQEGYITM